jgi:hypothetical protein
MNPIVYNKNGQFRYTDFIGYLPEFLRSEPDVVTYLQVMSDYINNAYRNVETTDEFELIKVCTSSDSKMVMRWMERLCNMFQLARDRGEKVMYLSVPRNNIKSNVIVGNSTAEYQRTITVDLDEIADSISAARSRVGTGLDDGDVVYVNYSKRPMKETVAYYYVKASDKLLKDPMGTTQDPFTDTYNDPTTAIQFGITDVGKVLRRYGGTHDGIVYYEVCLPVTITSIERVAASGNAVYDIDNDGLEDTIFVDYYNLKSATSDSYNTYIKFAKDNGFNWVGNFPSGMFYFRDTSGYNISGLTDEGYMATPDTLTTPSVDKYRITNVEKKSGFYRVYTDTFTGVYNNALFYVMQGSESLGVYRMNGNLTKESRIESGALYIDLVNVSGTDTQLDTKFAEKPTVLVLIPLAKSVYVPNYADSCPMIKWEPDEITGVDTFHVGVNADIQANEVERVENNVLFTGKVYPASTQTITLSGNYTTKIYTDMHLYSTVFKNNDPESPRYGKSPEIVKVESSRYSNGLTNITISGGSVNINEALGNDSIMIYDCHAGYIKDHYEGSDAYYDIYIDESGNIKEGMYVVVSHLDQATMEITKETLLQIDRKEVEQDDNHIVHVGFASTIGATLQIDPMDVVSLLTPTDVAVYKFNSVKIGEDGNVIGVVNSRSYTGNIFSAAYMLAKLKGTSSVTLLRMVTDVLEYDETATYNNGDYVYNPKSHQVMKIIKDTSGDPLDIDNLNNAMVDRIVHYSVGYKVVDNAFMPYSGPVSVLDYEETPNYAGDMSTVRLPLYIKKVNDTRLKYGWNQRQYLYYRDNIGVAPMSRSGFLEIYAGDVNSPVDIDLSKQAHLLPESTMLYGSGTKEITVDVDSEPIATVNEDGSWTVTVNSAGHGLRDGAVVKVVVDQSELYHEIFELDEAKVIVVSPDVFQYITNPEGQTDLVARIGNTSKISITYDRSYIDDQDAYPIDGDIVVLVDENNNPVSDVLYEVNSGEWKVIDPTTIRTPSTIYSRHNLFDVSVTNPVFAISDGFVIKNIIYDPSKPGEAELQMSKRVAELDGENVYDGVGRVYIENVNQGIFNGWHTIKKVNNGGSIVIIIDESVPVDDIIAPVTNRQMLMHVGRWYKYTLYSYDWDKKSNLTSYVTSNSIVNPIGLGGSTRIVTKYAHKLSIGDRVLIDTGTDDSVPFVYEIDSDTTRATIDQHIKENRVVAVVDDYTVDLENPVMIAGSIYRGVIADEYNLSKLRGEYALSIDGEVIKLRTGDVVIPLKQTCLDEIHGWRVTENTAWIPMTNKRTFKIDEISVDMTRNPAYDAGDDLENEVEFKYVTYTDVDVTHDVGSMRVGYGNARNYHFEHPYIEHLDTTQNVDLEYSSKYDYGSVAPRNDMDPSFKGVPDMGYPLAERIERLAYLRDPNVIDLDLIGYLARFMGYDITAVADDIRSSNIYRNSAEREEAVRETIAHLPQFYALSGTKPGINMLMATFGIVGELVTMWTSTDDPYGKLVRQDEVGRYIDADRAAKKTNSAWVPTPHVTLDVLNNENFNSVLLGNEELSRMKEQIRRCKPINVVFDGIRVVYSETVDVPIWVFAGNERITGSTVVIGYDDIPMSEDPCMDEDCDF